MNNTNSASHGESPSTPCSSLNSQQGNAGVLICQQNGTGSAMAFNAQGNQRMPVSSEKRTQINHETPYTKISKCKQNNCNLLQTNYYFNSTNTRRRYCTVNHDNEHHVLSCDSTNVIYMLTCSKCQAQYVGETCQPRLSSRISSHRCCRLESSNEEG